MMSSTSNSWTKEAWMAAPRTESSDGLMAVAEVDGASIVVERGKTRERLDAILGVWDVPPERMTLIH